MEEFASIGLRTLMFGMKKLSLSSDQIADIKQVPDETFEDGVELLGITGLEDLLQDNVKHCIKDFRMADIKVWMLTGDKGATAHNIAISCGLIDPKEHEVVKIKSDDNLKSQV